MSKYGVTPQKETELIARMAACGLLEGDIEEKHIRSGGPGGQHVNRTATCIYLKHRPTGLEVKMQRERSQGLNRFFARRRMCELLEAQSGGGTAADAEREKVRKQKARRKRRGKSKVKDEGPSADDADGRR